MEFCWVTINVKDMEQSLAFYRDVVGLRVDRRMKPMPGTEIAFLGNGGTEVELIRNEKNSDCQYGKDISLGFVVDSVEKAMEEMKAKGVTIHSGEVLLCARSERAASAVRGAALRSGGTGAGLPQCTAAQPKYRQGNFQRLTLPEASPFIRARISSFVE